MSEQTNNSQSTLIKNISAGVQAVILCLILWTVSTVNSTREQVIVTGKDTEAIRTQQNQMQELIKQMATKAEVKMQTDYIQADIKNLESRIINLEHNANIKKAN